MMKSTNIKKLSRKMKFHVLDLYNQRSRVVKVNEIESGVIDDKKVKAAYGSSDRRQITTKRRVRSFFSSRPRNNDPTLYPER
jgi:hypothetical protein